MNPKILLNTLLKSWRAFLWPTNSLRRHEMHMLLLPIEQLFYSSSCRTYQESMICINFLSSGSRRFSRSLWSWRMLSGLILEDNRTKRAMMTDKVEEMALLANKRQMHSQEKIELNFWFKLSHRNSTKGFRWRSLRKTKSSSLICSSSKWCKRNLVLNRTCLTSSFMGQTKLIKM